MNLCVFHQSDVDIRVVFMSIIIETKELINKKVVHPPFMVQRGVKNKRVSFLATICVLIVNSEVQKKNPFQLFTKIELNLQFGMIKI